MKNGMYTDNNGNKFWYKDDTCHREDEPAINYEDGHKEWWIHGALHREDGPAMEYTDGYKEWWLNGVEVTEAEVMRKPS